MKRNLVLVALSLCVLACSDASVDNHAEQRGALLFDLTQDDVQSLHDRYVPDEDISLTTERLTAPFDCALYDDLCKQVGVTQAIDFTEQVVELALAGATDEEINAFNDAFLMEAMDLREEIEADEEVTHRSSTGWATDTSGRYRLRSRNGITTPIVGSRQAWTEAKTQRRNSIGIWNSRSASQICVNTGPNALRYSWCEAGQPCDVIPVGQVNGADPNPPNSCVSGTSSHKDRTYHSRSSQGSVPGGWSWFYTLTARGSASASISGRNLSDTIANHSRTF